MSYYNDGIGHVLAPDVTRLVDRLTVGCKQCGSLTGFGHGGGSPHCPVRLCGYCYDRLREWFIERLTLENGEQWLDRTARQQAGVVYFVRRHKLIKIGTTLDLAERLRALGNPELLATEPGGLRRERQLHFRFDYLRREGEWFRPSRALLGYIESLT